MNKSQLTYRMYGLVPYQLTGIQAGIQYGHAVVEFSNEFGQTEEYKKWSRIDKTSIVLNGGTTNTNNPGTLNIAEMELFAADIPHACFYEPDLGDQLLAVVWLADERTFDRVNYPDFVPFEDDMNDEAEAEWYARFEAEDKEELDRIIFLRNFQKGFRKA